MRLIKNIALAMILIWIFQFGFNFCAHSVKDFFVKHITISYEDKSENILRKHRMAYGAVGILAAKKHGKDLEKGWKEGVLAGEIAYLGKKIVRKRGFGILGQAIHSLGVSMLENQILNKPLFSRYKIFLPPASLEFDIREGFHCYFLAGSLVGIFANFGDVNDVVDFKAYFESLGTRIIKSKHLVLLVGAIFENPAYLLKEIKKDLLSQRDYFQPGDSFLAGTPIFIFKTPPPPGYDGYNGLNIGGIITVKKDFEALPHEMIHACQVRELAIVNLFIERNICRDFPVLFTQDLVCFLLWEWREEEPKVYDKIYNKK